MDKKERVKTLALTYYQKKEVLDAIFNFSKNREISPKYFEGFGKRPDTFQYPSDILSMVKKGATSFHCSVELWKDPLTISTGMNEDKLNELREGWDLIIDIDCPWLDISKKTARAIIDFLDSYKVENVGIKFSGSKGFHIIIPWSAFPEKIDDIQTKDMFPLWPRAVISFIKERSRKRLIELIKDMDLNFSGLKGFMGIECKECHNIAEEKFSITLRCDKCKPPQIETFKSSSRDYKPKKCPNCRSQLIEKDSKSFYVCNTCNINSTDFPSNFSEVPQKDIFKLLGLDVLLVSPRHLFRMPYSLHEKTALASIVIPKDKIEDFQIMDADPFKVKVINYMPSPKKDEAKTLLLNALDWDSSQNKIKKINYSELEKESGEHKNKIFENIKLNLKELKEDYFPPLINKILEGLADGKKRSLFILLNFYRSLGYSLEEVEKKINEWNKKNKPPLKQGYINAQLIWHSKNKPVLPPNFDNQIYKEIGVYTSDSLSEKVKNPVAYVVRKMNFYSRQKKDDKQRVNKKH
ncbi:MAG TPA: hypothetical protein VI815_03260 [Candidatus Nanoarchaeia archaeon]|nr:hypothetical protein [Candidatus Nanoarchaeia archaeon]